MLSPMLEFPQKLHTRRRKRLQTPDRESISQKQDFSVPICVCARRYIDAHVEARQPKVSLLRN